MTAGSIKIRKVFKLGAVPFEAVSTKYQSERVFFSVGNFTNLIFKFKVYIPRTARVLKNDHERFHNQGRFYLTGHVFQVKNVVAIFDTGAIHPFPVDERF